MERFSVAVEEAVLDDLRRRLDAQLAKSLAEHKEGRSHGAPSKRMKR